MFNYFAVVKMHQTTEQRQVIAACYTMDAAQEHVNQLRTATREVYGRSVNAPIYRVKPCTREGKLIPAHSRGW